MTDDDLRTRIADVVYDNGDLDYQHCQKVADAVIRELARLWPTMTDGGLTPTYSSRLTDHEITQLRSLLAERPTMSNDDTVARAAKEWAEDR
jgi:hypothetical protein